MRKYLSAFSGDFLLAANMHEFRFFSPLALKSSEYIKLSKVIDRIAKISYERDL